MRPGLSKYCAILCIEADLISAEVMIMKHLNAILLITGLSFSMACEKFDPKDFPDLKIKTLRQGKGKNRT